MLCSVPWLTSGWYGVYAVDHSPRNEARSTLLRPARAWRRAARWSSGSGSSRRSTLARSASGMSSNRASTEAIPIASSIRARSSATCGPYGMSAPGGELFVGCSVEEGVHLRRVREPDAKHPARAVGVGVDDLGCSGEIVVGGGHLAGDRREQVA